ncbi:MAG: flagellar M-ring protein FliF, partial [Candidatus Melainabacteria bacterium HGW-Melainabacteria-1]
MASGYFQRLRDEGRTFYLKLTRPQKWILGGASAAALTAVVVATIWLQQPNWSTLYADLSSKDAGQMVAWLKENKIPYQLNAQGQGAAVQVPADRVHDVRLQMAAQDLPREGGVVGFELFDQDKIGMTNRVFDMNYQRALAGELSRTIMQMDGVERARVHLAIPKKQIFTDLQEASTASINLKLSPLTQLNETQVKGIAKLVAGSVPGLEQKNVTITDGEGNLLFDAEMADGKAQAALLNQEQLNLQKQVEAEIRGNVEQMLSRVVGRGRVNVQVKALLDFDREESVSKSFSPNDSPN